MNCKNCGAILNSNDLFCRQCGQKIVSDQEKSEEKQEINSYQPNNTVNYQTGNYQPNNTANYQTGNYQSNNTMNYQPYNQENDYKNNIGRIILIILLAIAFWIIGFELGKLFFKNDKKTNIDNSQLIQQDALIANNSNKNQNSSIINENTGKSSNKKQSYIVTSNNTKVYFDVADTLKEIIDEDDEYYEESRGFEKVNEDENLFILIGEIDVTKNEYMSYIEDKANSIKQNSEYSNVQLSEVKTKTVNGKEFLYRSLTYTAEDMEFKDLYLVCEIENRSSYVIEVDEYQLLTDEELNGLLNITIEK